MGNRGTHAKVVNNFSREGSCRAGVGVGVGAETGGIVDDGRLLLPKSRVSGVCGSESVIAWLVIVNGTRRRVDWSA